MAASNFVHASLVDHISEVISGNGELITELTWSFAEAIGKKLVVIKAILLPDRLVIGELTQMSVHQYAMKTKTLMEGYNTYEKCIWMLVFDNKMELIAPISIPFDQIMDYDWMSM